MSSDVGPHDSYRRFETLPGVYERRLRRTDVCRVLFAGTEAPTAIWEAWYELPSQRTPASRERARRLLQRLVACGWLEIRRESLVAGTMEYADVPDIGSALGDPAEWEWEWERRDGRPWLAFEATDLGATTLDNHLRHRPNHLVGFQGDFNPSPRTE